jgi:hypothetical protein
VGSEVKRMGGQQNRYLSMHLIGDEAPSQSASPSPSPPPEDVPDCDVSEPKDIEVEDPDVEDEAAGGAGAGTVCNTSSDLARPLRSSDWEPKELSLGVHSIAGAGGNLLLHSQVSSSSLLHWLQCVIHDQEQ